MRWDGQRAGASGVEALPGLAGLVRSVRSPEFDGITFHEVHAKSVLNRVPGGALPFSWTVNPYRGCSHACRYCMAGDTPVLLADGRTKPLAELEIGDAVFGTRVVSGDRRLTPTKVLARWRTAKPAYRVTLTDRTTLVAGAEHRFLTSRGWRYTYGGDRGERDRRPWLVRGARLVGVGAFAARPGDSAEYRAGYLHGLLRLGRSAHEAEAVERARAYLATFDSATAFAVAPREPGSAWQKGMLAGIFDADGSYLRGMLRISPGEPGTTATVCVALKNLGFRYLVPSRTTGGEARTVQLGGGLAEQLRFFHTVDPAVSRRRTVDGAVVRPEPGLSVVTVEPLGEELPLYDITTGTGDFIANGVVSHNCFARHSHTYLDFDSGRDFDTEIVVKVNAPEVLAAQLRRPGWTREPVAMGTNTDPYQRAEGRYRLMPGIIRALADSGTPMSVLTKGAVLIRDLSLLSAVAKEVPVGVAVSIALLDRDLQRRLEPGTPGPRARLDLVRRISDAGLPCGVLVAPVLPGLTDSVEALDAVLGEIAAAGATSATVFALHLRPGAREWFTKWLAAEYPALVPRYRELYRHGSYVSKGYRAWLAERVGRLLRGHGLAPEPFRPPEPPERPEVAPEPDPQLRLL